MKTRNNFIIKIPTNISLIYCNKKKIITFSGPIKKKSLQLKLKILVYPFKKIIKVTLTPFLNISNPEKKNLKAIQGTTITLIKQIIIEVSTTLHQKLKLIGIGYKAFFTETFNNKLITFKIGYSHLIYIQIPKNINFFCKKQTQLFILGNSYISIKQLAATIRSIKNPEPYKGKGILYANEKIILKKGKKV